MTEPLPDYVEFGGLGSAPGPLQCDDTTLYVFGLQADHAKLDALCQKVFNTPTGGAVDYRPLGDQVIASCGNFRGSAVTLSAGAGMTSRRVDSLIGGGAYSMCTEDVVASGASTVASWTNDDFCTNIAFALIPGGGGPPAGPTYPQLERGIRGLARGLSGGIARTFERRDRIFVPAYAWKAAA